MVSLRANFGVSRALGTGEPEGRWFPSGQTSGGFPELTATGVPPSEELSAKGTRYANANA
ncbi:MAG: hypothetical protein F6K28_30855 [Microcoleus sp. SIO2G3]|nr:hypothetical protein [Microcoleus sp. SIO2G3]